MNTLVLKNFGGVLEITPDAFELKRTAIAAAEPIKKVETEEEQMIAVAALRDLKAISKGMESTRKAVKAPVLELGKQIDAKAYDFLEEVVKAENILQGLINHFQRSQLEAQRKEQDRIEREKNEAARLEAEATRLREEAEKAKSVKERVKIEAKASEVEGKAFEASMAGELITTLTVAKPRGLVVKTRMDYQVLDPHVFVQAYPDLLKWNAETETLKLDRQRILEELNKERGLFHRSTFPEDLPGSETAMVKPPGLRIFESTKSHIR